MEKQDLKNLLENIYNLLAEDAPPFSNPIDANPLQLPWWEINGEDPPTGLPLYPTSPTRTPTPMPPMPGPNGRPQTDHNRQIFSRPALPPCSGGGPCTFQWVYTVHWEWNSQYGFWELVPNSTTPRPGGERDQDYGGYWQQRGDPTVPDGRVVDPTLEDAYGNPLPPPRTRWQWILRGLGLDPDRPTGYAPRDQQRDDR